MATFHLRVLTAEKSFFEGEVDRCIVRTATGDVGILPNHTPYLAPLGIGGLTIYQDGKPRLAAVAHGFLEVGDNQMTIIARTCEWADEIDLNRAEEARWQAEATLHTQASAKEMDVAQIKLKKAINRIRIAQK